MQELSPPQLRAWLDDTARPAPVMLDVREEWELERCHIDNAIWIPMRDVPQRMKELDPQANVVVICHHGVRSYHVARLLEHEGFSSVYNLATGVDGWARQVDPTMPTY
jgi:rhodanese-related sulfurtransferase